MRCFQPVLPCLRFAAWLLRQAAQVLAVHCKLFAQAPLATCRPVLASEAPILAYVTLHSLQMDAELVGPAISDERLYDCANVVSFGIALRCLSCPGPHTGLTHLAFPATSCCPCHAPG